MAKLSYSYYVDNIIIKSNVTATSEGQTEFTVVYEYDGLTNVFLNGILLNIDEYTLTANNLLTLNTGAQINDRIDLIESNIH